MMTQHTPATMTVGEPAGHYTPGATFQNKNTSRFWGYSTFLCFLMLLLASGHLMAQTYRWVDPATGKTMYSDTPPPKTVEQVRKINRSTGVEEPTLPYALQQASKNHPVTLYTGQECEACPAARELLVKRQIPFTEKPIQTQADIDELKALLKAEPLIPSLKVGEQTIKGFETGAYNSMLDLAGYPKAAAQTKESPKP